MGKFKRNNDTSTPLGGTEFFFFVKWRYLFYVYMGAILSGAWHVICAFNKGILFIGMLEDPAVPVWAGESAMTRRGSQHFHHAFPLRYFSISHFQNTTALLHRARGKSSEHDWASKGSSGVLGSAVRGGGSTGSISASSLTPQQRQPGRNTF